MSQCMDYCLQQCYEKGVGVATSASKNTAIEILQWAFAAIVVAAIVLVIIWAVRESKKDDDEGYY